MRLFLLTIFISTCITYCYSQQKRERKVYVEFHEPAKFYEANTYNFPLKDTVYHSNTGFLIYPNHYVDKSTGEDYIICEYPKFKTEGIQQKVSNRNLIESEAHNENVAIHVNFLQKDVDGKFKSINGKRLAISRTDFELLEKTIHYSTSWKKIENYSLSFGVLTVPFKLRPKQDTTNFNLTTDITLGPYFGVSKRLSSKNKYYLTIPFTTGLSFINVNDNNTSNEKFEDAAGVSRESPGVLE